MSTIRTQNREFEVLSLAQGYVKRAKRFTLRQQCSYQGAVTSAKTQANRGRLSTTELASMLKSHNNQTLPAKSLLFQQTKSSFTLAQRPFFPRVTCCHEVILEKLAFSTLSSSDATTPNPLLFALICALKI